jgi:hypothetical protein
VLAAVKDTPLRGCFAILDRSCARRAGAIAVGTKKRPYGRTRKLHFRQVAAPFGRAVHGVPR